MSNKHSKSYDLSSLELYLINKSSFTLLNKYPNINTQAVLIWEAKNYLLLYGCGLKTVSLNSLAQRILKNASIIHPCLISFGWIYSVVWSLKFLLPQGSFYNSYEINTTLSSTNFKSSSIGELKKEVKSTQNYFYLSGFPIKTVTLKKSSWEIISQLGSIFLSFSANVVFPPFVTLLKNIVKKFTKAKTNLLNICTSSHTHFYIVICKETMQMQFPQF